MDELTRFARILMERLATRPEGVARPVSVAEVRKSVLPYRAQRKALGLDSVEDYETVLLRLVAEERVRCREELGQPNPDLTILETIGESTIQVTSLAAGKVVEDGHSDGSQSSAPMPSEASKAAAPAPAPAAGQPPPANPGRQEKTCRFCQGKLPLGRTATFCPHCGERLIPLTCERCGTELEAGWKHCITCGAPVQNPYSGK